jgi:hypothetical protein
LEARDAATVFIRRSLNDRSSQSDHCADKGKAGNSDEKNNESDWQVERDGDKASAVDSKVWNGSAWFWTAAAPQCHKSGGNHSSDSKAAEQK